MICPSIRGVILPGSAAPKLTDIFWGQGETARGDIPERVPHQQVVASQQEPGSSPVIKPGGIEVAVYHYVKIISIPVQIIYINRFTPGFAGPVQPVLIIGVAVYNKNVAALLRKKNEAIKSSSAD
jgi:hypothetical protein